MTTDPLILADVGGTNTRVALAHAGGVDHASIRRYPNAGRPGLEPILTDYLADLGVARCAGACVAAAGPVEDGRAEMTNLAWVITRQGVAGATGAPTVAILNDLQAQGHALDGADADAHTGKAARTSGDGQRGQRSRSRASLVQQRLRCAE